MEAQGLGLSKKLVEGQGGSVSVKVNLVRGSAFSFILPFGKQI
jgi:signal transduction histidine kinase